MENACSNKNLHTNIQHSTPHTSPKWKQPKYQPADEQLPTQHWGMPRCPPCWQEGGVRAQPATRIWSTYKETRDRRINRTTKQIGGGQRVGQGKMGRDCLPSTGFAFWVLKCPRNRQWWWLRNIVNMLTVTGSEYFKWFMWWMAMFYYSKLKLLQQKLLWVCLQHYTECLMFL